MILISWFTARTRFAVHRFFVIVPHPPWFAASPLHRPPSSINPRPPSHQLHSASHSCFHFISFIYSRLSHLALATFDWTYTFVLARHLRSLLRVIPNHISTRHTSMYFYPIILYTLLHYLFLWCDFTCRIFVHTLEEPPEIVRVNARRDTMSEIRDPSFRRTGPCTKCSAHATHAVFDCLASTI